LTLKLLAFGDLRAKSHDHILRPISVRSFLALTNHPQNFPALLPSQRQNASCQHNSSPVTNQFSGWF
jgi:hypothetical protein